MRLFGAREKEVGRVAGSSSSMWSMAVGHHQGGHWGLPHSPLDPSTRASISWRHAGWHQYCTARVFRRKTVRIICLELTRSKGRGVPFVFILLRGHKPIPDGIFRSKPVTSVVNKVKKEGFNYYLGILSQGEDTSPMISGLVRIKGGIMSQGQALEPEETHCQFHL